MTADNTRPADGGFVMVPRSELERVIHELRTYNPIADECKGVHIHSVWARELESLSAAPQQPPGTFTGVPVVVDHSLPPDTFRIAQQGGQEVERGLQTPRRVKAVELLLSLGYQWDGAQWCQPQQPAEAVAERLPDGYVYRYPDGSIRHSSGREINGMRPVESIPYFYRSQPPAIDIGKLRQIAAELRDNAHEHRQEDREVGMLADEQEAQFNEELAERIEAALIGDGGEKGNG